MPREQINYPRKIEVLQASSDEPESIKIDWEDPTLHVNWDSNYVQVSINLTAARIKLWADQLDGETHSAFYTPELSRQEINKLIRVLRTARDKAYGRDE